MTALFFATSALAAENCLDAASFGARLDDTAEDLVRGGASPGTDATLLTLERQLQCMPALAEPLVGRLLLVEGYARFEAGRDGWEAWRAAGTSHLGPASFPDFDPAYWIGPGVGPRRFKIVFGPAADGAWVALDGVRFEPAPPRLAVREGPHVLQRGTGATTTYGAILDVQGDLSLRANVRRRPLHDWIDTDAQTAQTVVWTEVAVVAVGALGVALGAGPHRACRHGAYASCRGLADLYAPGLVLLGVGGVSLGVTLPLVMDDLNVNDTPQPM